MSALHDGWYGVVADGPCWRPVTEWETRRTLVRFLAEDSDEATHVGYYNGTDWEDVEAIEG